MAKNIKDLGDVVSEKKMFYVLPIVKSMCVCGGGGGGGEGGHLTPRTGPLLIPGAWLAESM